MTTVTVERVTKRYAADQTDGKPILAVDDVSLTIPEGEALVLLGPSGCGKTTLLRLIAGLEPPTSGDVLYNSKPVASLDAIDRIVGMVFQDYALIPHWNAGRNVGFFLRLRNREQEVPERVARVSEITGVDIKRLMGRMPRELSGGEKQRVAIARAFARDMHLLLFDEPFANLDAKFRTGARLALKKLLNAYPVTTVMVTHDQTEAASIGQRVALMREGQIVQIGTYDDLHDNPQDVFVAQFIGSPPMNLFFGMVQDGHWWGDGFGGYPMGKLGQAIADDTGVVLGVRAEHMHLSSDDGRSIAGTVDAVTPFLAERHQLLEVGREDHSWMVQVPEGAQVQRGATVFSAPDLAHVYYFDTETRQRLA